jgi:CheY-like chemotaxis protein
LNLNAGSGRDTDPDDTTGLEPELSNRAGVASNGLEPELSGARESVEFLRREVLILHSEDDPAIRILASIILHRGGLPNVVSVTDGMMGMHVAERLHPDIMINDWMMFPVDGLELLQQVKGHPELSTVPVIMLTARVNPLDRAFALEQGAAGYITLPFGLRELVGTVTALRVPAVRRPLSLEELSMLRSRARANEWHRPLIQMLSFTLDGLPRVPEEFGKRRYPVAFSSGAATALPFARRILPDVIVADFDLPERSGLEILSQLKTDPVVRDIPVVMCGSGGERRRRAMTMGAHAVFETVNDASFLNLIETLVVRDDL